MAAVQRRMHQLHDKKRMPPSGIGVEKSSRKRKWAPAECVQEKPAWRSRARSLLLQLRQRPDGRMTKLT